MSERFGLSHRQVVRDVNEGKVVPPVDEAVTSSRGVSGGPSTQVIRSDDGSRRLVESLLKAGGVVADKMSAEAKRKAKIDGYNMAGTEEGRAAADEMGQTLDVKLFGPGAKLRSAQERIAQDQTDDNIAKLRSDLDDFGHKMTEEEWREHTDTQLASMTDKFEDEGLKDLITERFGRNIQAVKRDYEKESKKFVQAEERETYVNSIHTGAKMAQADLASGDPQRQEDAEARLTEALIQPEGMSDEAYRGAVAAAVKNELVMGRSGLFDVAKGAGILEELTYEDTQELEQAKLLHDAKNDEDFIVGMKQLEYLADTEGNIEQVTALAKKLQAQNPMVFGKAGISGVVERAFDRQVEIQAEATRRRTAEHQALVGDPALRRESAAHQQMAVEDALEEIGMEGARKELEEYAAANGDTVPQGQEIPPGAVNRWLLENPRAWARTWASNGIATDRVSHLATTVVQNIGRVDMTKEGAKQLKADLENLDILRQESPELFAKQVTSEEGARLRQYYREMSVDGQDPFEVVTRLRDLEERRTAGTTFEPQKAERLQEKVGNVVDAFIKEKGDKYFGIWDRDPENLKSLRQSAEQYYAEEWERTGDSQLSVDYALERLNRGSTVIGNTFVQGGAKLDERSYGSSFDRYLEGINDSDVSRQRLILKYGLDADFDIRSDHHRIVVNPDGSGATFFIEADNDMGGRTEQPVRVDTPTSAKHLLPTSGEQSIESIRENLLESRTGGSFGQQFEEVKQQPN